MPPLDVRRVPRRVAPLFLRPHLPNPLARYVRAGAR